jgi:hypothetical protein
MAEVVLVGCDGSVWVLSGGGDEGVYLGEGAGD